MTDASQVTVRPQRVTYKYLTVLLQYYCRRIYERIYGKYALAQVFPTPSLAWMRLRVILVITGSDSDPIHSIEMDGMLVLLVSLAS